MNPNNERLDAVTAQARIPIATYRLQFNREFTVAQAREIADDLHQLGISDCYASPLFQAAPESTHGYDICDFGQLNPALGARAEFDALSERLRQLDMGLLLDMVPNHMGTDLSNSWWRDVLENGRHSRYADYFDIDWQPQGSDRHDRVLVPVLEDHYAKVLEAGKLKLGFENGRFYVAYYDRHFPVSTASSLGLIEELRQAISDKALQLALNSLEESLSVDQPQVPGEPVPAPLHERLASLDQNQPAFRQALATVLQRYNGRPAEAASFDPLDRLLRTQHYRLAFWRVGPEEVNYRRFFDVTQLISVRMERPAVFKAAHELVFSLLAAGQVTGLRIDHPDGLWDPKEYFENLQENFLTAELSRMQNVGAETAEQQAIQWVRERLQPLELEQMHSPIAQGEGHTSEAPRSDPLAGKTPAVQWPLYVVAEKILSRDERLPRDWPLAGTTGYDFLNVVNGIFVQGAHRERFDRIYRKFTGKQESFSEQVYQGKKRILEHSLARELNALTQRFKAIANATRAGQDFTLRQLRSAVAEVVATFPVYRTYVREESEAPTPVERSYVERAVAEAKKRNPEADGSIYDFLQDLLLLRFPRDLDTETLALAHRFVMRFQQLSGPVTAKGVEDTAFYNCNRLISLNEVGGDPDQFGITLAQFHQHNLAQAEQWPDTLLATATHDTKRGEDVRARINVLSEIPALWQSAVERWCQLNAAHKTPLAGQPAPDRNDEYLIYQTLVGAWPEIESDHTPGAPSPKEPGPSPAILQGFKERVTGYMIKAIREAKAHTSWTDPNTAYESAVRNFLERTLDPNISAEFVKDLRKVQGQASFFGKINSLAQVLLKITSPGVPDFYQGTELWDLSLVDPDNRRPVDFELRRRLRADLLQRLGSAERSKVIAELLERSETGLLKLFVTMEGLQFRKTHHALFRRGAYLPLTSSGPKREHVCAFARVNETERVVVVVPRLSATLSQGRREWPCGESIWGDTRLKLPKASAASEFVEIFTGRKIRVAGKPGSALLPIAELLANFPVALLSAAAARP